MLYGFRKENYSFCFYLGYWKSHLKLEDTLLRMVSSGRLPKVVRGLIILSKVVPTVWVDRDAKFTGLSCTIWRRCDRSTMACNMAAICGGNQNVVQPLVPISGWQSPACGLTPQIGCVLSHNLGTQKMWKPDWLTPITQLFSGHLLVELLALYSEKCK